MKVKNYLLGYKNLYIFQDTELFNFSLDSVLLPNFITINDKTKKILDIGTGNAPIPLILTTKTKAKIIGVEIQEKAYELAKESIAINKLSEQIQIINEDIREYYGKTESDTFDIIVCNPPFFKSSKKSQGEYKRIARHEESLELGDIFKIAKKLLRNNGNIGVVNRPERLVEIIEAMRENNIEPKKMRLAYPSKNGEANVLLIEGKKNGKQGLKILPPLFVHKKNGEYTAEVKKFFVGGK